MVNIENISEKKRNQVVVSCISVYEFTVDIYLNVLQISLDNVSNTL